MKIFKDKDGREWVVSITVGSVKQVKAALGVDLLDCGADALARLFGDVVRVVEVLYVLCAEQCRSRGVSEDAFAGSFCGESLEAAADAFALELADFFPSPRARDALRRLIAAGKRVEEELFGQSLARLEELSPADLARDILDGKTPGKQSGNSPAPAASTPTP